MKGSVLILCLFLFNELRFQHLPSGLQLTNQRNLKIKKKKSALSASSAVETEKLEGKKRRTTVKLIYSKMLFDQIKKQRKDSSTCFVEEWQ